MTFGGLGTAWFVYGSGRVDWLSLRVRLAPLHRLFANGWYIDEYYAALIVTPGKAIAAFTAYRIDVGFIDGIVNGIGSAFRRLAGVGRNIQTGFVRTYAAAVFVGRGRDRRLRGVPPVNRLLTIVTFLPLVGLVVIMVGGKELKDDAARWITLVVALATFVVSLVVLGRFEQGDPGFQMVEQATWVKDVGLQYLVGIDGISIWMVLLTTFLFPVAVLASWKIDKDVRLYMGAMLALETAVLGSFVSLDLLLFFLFFEAILVPMYLLIGGWGGERRVYAAVKFFLYTMAGSAFLLVVDHLPVLPLGRRPGRGEHVRPAAARSRWARRSRWRPPGGSSSGSSSRSP